VSLKVVIALVIGVLAVWSVVSTTLWALGGEGPTRVQTVTVETP
jgi:hypothetical protein